MSEVIPDGWRLTTIDEIAETYAGGTPNTQILEYWENGDIPWMSSGEVHNKRITHTHQRITTLGYKNSSAKFFPEKTVLIALAGQGKTRGTAAISEITLTTNQSIAGIVISDRKTIPDYVFHNLDSRYEELRAASGGSGRAGLNLSIIGEQSISLPPLPEQQKIATILSSVDDVIEKTRAQIDKLNDLKIGMMQELLTQGIGHTEFKDSPVGRIPTAWSVTRLQNLLADTKYPLRSGPFGSALLKNELVASGIPFLGIDNVHVEEFRSIFKRFVSNEKFQELGKYAVFPNDVMITIMGTVGRCCVVPENIGEALSSKHVWTLTIKKDEYIPDLLCWQINFSDWVKKQFANDSQGGVMESISSSTLKNLHVPVPPIEEQRKISDIHKTLSQRITREREHLEILLHLKKALMQDLLTCKVRVKIDVTETVAA